MQRLLAVGLVLAAALTGACTGIDQNSSVLAPTTPSSTSPAASAFSMLGTWTSPITAVPAGSCAGFSWQVTSQTSNSLAGTFSATCANGITASGTASGEVNGNTVPYTVTGTANVPGLPPCPFSLAGTGQIVDSNTMLVPYSGTTCVGAIKGEETLRRPAHAETVPEPTPEPEPEPPAPPPAPVESSFHVGPGGPTMTRAEQVVNATASEFASLMSARGTEAEAQAAATELLRRVIWHLRHAGFDAARQKNPSGAISGDKLTMVADGAWHAVDIFFDYGTPGVPVKVIFWEVFPANPVADEGIPD